MLQILAATKRNFIAYPERAGRLVDEKVVPAVEETAVVYQPVRVIQF
jgi:hypothetical protein